MAVQQLVGDEEFLSGKERERHCDYYDSGVWCFVPMTYTYCGHSVE